MLSIYIFIYIYRPPSRSDAGALEHARPDLRPRLHVVVLPVVSGS